ncbi:MAG: hypothetical protein ACLSHC_04935 [Bilophila wadsworthia]
MWVLMSARAGSASYNAAGSTPILEAIQSFSIPETMDWETPGLADRIREALSAFLPHGGRDADIWVRLPDGQDELRHYRIPKVSPKDRDAIAKMAAIREKTFDEAENIFDYRVDAEVLDKGVPRLPVTAMIANKALSTPSGIRSPRPAFLPRASPPGTSTRKTCSLRAGCPRRGNISPSPT